MPAAAVEASAAEAACMEAACVHSAAEAGVSARGVRPDYAAMIEAAEGTGVDADCSVLGMAELSMPWVEVLESRTVRVVRMMVIPHRMPVPVRVPVIPAPAKAGEEPDVNSGTEIYPGI